MQYNTYYQKDVWEEFEGEKDKSKLVNELLRVHYKLGDKVQLQHTPKGHNAFYELAKEQDPPTSKVEEESQEEEDEPELVDPLDGLVWDHVNGGVFEEMTQEKVESNAKMIKELKKRGQVV
jgi:hypothetical protein